MKYLYSVIAGFALIYMGFIADMAFAEDINASETGYCGMCGKEISSKANIKFSLVFPNGNEQSFSCAGCGLGAIKAGGAKSARTLDFMRGEWVDAKEAWYVMGSDFGSCCPPYWVSFANKDEAEKFSKGFGGDVFNYEEALNQVGKK